MQEIQEKPIEKVENKAENAEKQIENSIAKTEIKPVLVPPLINEPPKEITELKPQDLEEAVKIYDAIRAMRKRIEPMKDKLLIQELDRKMAEIVAQLKNSLKSDTPIPLRNSAILRAKYALLGMSFEKMIGFALDKQGEIIWKNIKISYDSIFERYNEIISYFIENPISANQKSEVTEIPMLQEEIKNLKNEIKNLNEEKELLKNNYENEKNELLQRIMQLEENNKKSKKNSPRPITAKTLQENIPKDVKLNAPTAPMPSKNLTLKQLKDMIFDMYEQKLKYDEKALENKQPKETLEQFMYVYLNQVYGLKSLIIEGAGGIIQGIKKYSSQDSDVALFGKILRNECDEDFRLVFAEVKAAMTNILKEKLKATKYKLKNDTELNKIIKDIQNSEIEELYWNAIIKKMYNEEHYKILCEKIKERIEQSQNSLKFSGRKLTREEINAQKAKQGNKILFSDFQKIVLDFQLATHETYLKKFTELFKEIDTKTDGVLDENGFRMLLERMGLKISESEIEKLLQIVDPYNNQKITYSECLSLFSSVFSHNFHVYIGNNKY